MNCIIFNFIHPRKVGHGDLGNKPKYYVTDKSDLMTPLWNKMLKNQGILAWRVPFRLPEKSFLSDNIICTYCWPPLPLPDKCGFIYRYECSVHCILLRHRYYVNARLINYTIYKQIPWFSWKYGESYLPSRCTIQYPWRRIRASDLCLQGSGGR